MRLHTYSLALLLLGTLGAAQAEPMTPLLAPAKAARLRAQLWRTPGGPTRLKLLLQLADDLVARHDEQETPLDSAAVYGRQALALS